MLCWHCLGECFIEGEVLVESLAPPDQRAVLFGIFPSCPPAGADSQCVDVFENRLRKLWRDLAPTMCNDASVSWSEALQDSAASSRIYIGVCGLMAASPDSSESDRAAASVIRNGLSGLSLT
jgi:hypothetical protein